MLVRHALLIESLGGPGVGKGTQCAWLACSLGLVHISVGELLREDAVRPSLHRDVHIETIMSNASLIPYNYVRKTLETCLVQHMQHGRTNFLIDDFPRSKEQTRFFDEVESVFSTKTFKDGGFIIYAEMESKGNSSLSLLGRCYARTDAEESQNFWESWWHHRGFS